MRDFVGFILLLTTTSVSIVALLTLLPFMLPRRVAHAHQVIQAAPGRTLVIGLANALFFLVIAAILAQGGDGGGLLALIILLALLALAAIGLAGLVLLLRGRIYPHAADTPGLNLTVRTAVLLTLAALLPGLGWFVLTPLLLLVGLGAALTTLVKRGGEQVKGESFHNS
jgi:hypothetical protein